MKQKHTEKMTTTTTTRTTRRTATKRTALDAVLLLAVMALGTVAGYSLQYCEAPLPEFVPIDESKYRLAQVTLVTRHGDRAPLTLMGDESDVTWDKCDYREYQVPENDKSVSYQKVVIPPYEYAPKVQKKVFIQQAILRQPHLITSFTLSLTITKTHTHKHTHKKKANDATSPVTHSHTSLNLSM